LHLHIFCYGLSVFFGKCFICLLLYFVSVAFRCFKSRSGIAQVAMTIHACFKCFICFGYMLQMFYLNVSKIDLRKAPCRAPPPWGCSSDERHRRGDALPRTRMRHGRAPSSRGSSSSERRRRGEAPWLRATITVRRRANTAAHAREKRGERKLGFGRGSCLLIY